jgi:carboxylate-amine ligase
LHVHVGLPDPDTMIRVHNGLRAELPLLLALSANSPFWFGKDSGLASARTAILRSYPRTGMPRAFADFDDYCNAVAALCAAAGVPDYTYVWWDVRPHPRLGTIEVRIMDAQTSLEASIGLATLVHGLVGWLLFSPTPPPDPPHEVLQESAARAMRYGADASLADRAGRLRPVASLAREAVARAAAYVADPRPLEAVEQIVRTGGGARRQREAFMRGGRSGLLRTLVRETAAEARPATTARPRLRRFAADPRRAA